MLDTVNHPDLFMYHCIYNLFWKFRIGRHEVERLIHILEQTLTLLIMKWIGYPVFWKWLNESLIMVILFIKVSEDILFHHWSIHKFMKNRGPLSTSVHKFRRVLSLLYVYSENATYLHYVREYSLTLQYDIRKSTHIRDWQWFSYVLKKTRSYWKHLQYVTMREVNKLVCFSGHYPVCQVSKQDFNWE